MANVQNNPAWTIGLVLGGVVMDIALNRWSSALPYGVLLAAILVTICAFGLLVWKRFSRVRQETFFFVCLSGIVLWAVWSCASALEHELPSTTAQLQKLPVATPAAQQGVVPPLPKSDPHLLLDDSPHHQVIRAQYWLDQYDAYFPQNRGRANTQTRYTWVNRQLAKEGLGIRLHLPQTKTAATPASVVSGLPPSFYVIGSRNDIQDVKINGRDGSFGMAGDDNKTKNVEINR